MPFKADMAITNLNNFDNNNTFLNLLKDNTVAWLFIEIEKKAHLFLGSQNNSENTERSLFCHQSTSGFLGNFK